ncbi:signal peptidase II [candidate division WOR-3 bacterium RBG_13_43_14]|uniref:Lipoprotein signal peptidase n=1 Tax=candidate division WOR-3 bacterium RBG_13_43_14 TaxID=1802590 RepID=A0A1F4UBG7_UNCW3|nr:MAG: signal peptidase II [candidate division WOR-3 bacterium RBG_13_43_14]
MLISRNLKLFFPFLWLTFFLDQISKIIIVNTLTPFQTPVNIVGSLLRFKLTYNPYGVFSLSFGPPVLYFILQIIGIIVLGYVALTIKDKLGVIIFGIIIGGALGNLFDRFRVNYVIDFIDMGIGNVRWFVYNLADAFITVGAVFLLIREFFVKKPAVNKPTDNTTHS